MKREAVDVYRYESYKEILDKIGSPPINRHNRAIWERDFAKDGAQMLDSPANIGTDCYNALTAAKKPLNIKTVTEWLRAGEWEAGVRKIRKEIGQVEIPTLTDIRPRGTWCETGDTLSVDKVMAGEYDRAWYGRKKGVVRRPPPLHIFSDISVNCDGDRLFWRGATTCAFAEAAMAVGHRVRVEQVINIEGLMSSGAGFLSVTKIKDYDQLVNPSAFACIGASVASMRLTDFGHCTHVPEAIHGYGGTRTITVERLRSRGLIDPTAHTLLIPNTMTSKEGALDWIAKACADLERRVTTGEWEAPSPELGGLAVPQEELVW